MKHVGSILILSAVFLSAASLLSQKAKANMNTVTNNVNVTSTGGNASSNVSISNNVNTSTSNTSVITQSGKSHVEVNGKIYDSDGDLDVEEGGSSVHIKNGNEVKVNSKTTTNISGTPSESEMKEKMNKAKREAQEKLKEKKKEIKSQIKKQKFDLRKFLKSEMELLRGLATFKFLFGNK